MGHQGEPRRDPRPEAFIDERPWGRFEVLAHNEASTVKIITVNPGSRLSSQRHQMRDEMWTVLDGELLVDVGGAQWSVSPGEKVWIPRGTVHRATNKGEQPGRFLEIAFGTFDEADIERLDDDYSRS